MKRLIPFILILLLLTGCGKQNTPPETTVPTTQPAPTETTVPGPEGIAEEKETETVWLLARMVRTSDDGTQDWVREYDYSEAGLLLEERQYSENLLAFRTVYTYESGEQPASVLSYFTGDDQTERLASGSEFTYNELGQLIQQRLLTDSGEPWETIDFTYDSYGNLLTQHSIIGEAEQTLTYEYEYDDAGNMLICRDYEDGNLIGWTEETYDAENRVVSGTYYGPDGEKLEYREITWEGTTETRLTYDSEGTLIMSDVTTYDSEGRITLVESQYYGGTITMTEYIYEPYEIQK